MTNQTSNLIRVFNVTAPSVVGRYFLSLPNGTSIGSKNFSSVIVSADPNPAYISGTIRYGGRNSTYAVHIHTLMKPPEGGKICATGITDDGRIVMGQAFFNSTGINCTCNGGNYISFHSEYTLYGLAPGRYRLNATAAGYAPMELQYEIVLKAGQSLENVDMSLEHSPCLKVVAWSRWMKQPERWGYNYFDGIQRERKITLEILDSWNTTVLMMKGVDVEITLVFQKQRIISLIDTWNYGPTVPGIPVRFEIYDSRTHLVGANISYAPLNAKTHSTRISGFGSYYGNVTTRWVNYYDTVDGTLQRDCGLKPDVYTIKAYVAGYYQQSEPLIDARALSNMSVSVVILMSRMRHLYGQVRTFNSHFGNYARISWVTVEASGADTALRAPALDGFYEMWLNPGQYLVTFSLPCYKTQAYRLQIPHGSDVEWHVQLLPYEMRSVSSFSSGIVIPFPSLAKKDDETRLEKEFLQRISDLTVRI